jgi:hypothetical protein
MNHNDDTDNFIEIKIMTGVLICLALVSLLALFLSRPIAVGLGVSFGCFLMSHIRPRKTRKSWKYRLGLSILFGLALGVCSFFVPRIFPV